MNKIKQILAVLSIPIFMWNCEKDGKYNTIEGTLSPGLEMSQNSMGSVPLVIVKIWDTVDFARVTIDPVNFEATKSVLTDAGGYFHFDSLPDGNYFVTPGIDFKFADADYVKVSLSDGAVQAVNKTVNRVPLRNGPGYYTLYIESVSDFAVTQIEFFSDNTSLFSQEISLVLRSWDERYIYAFWGRSYTFLLDPDLNPTYQLTLVRDDLTFTTPKIPFFSYMNEYKIWENVPYYDMQKLTNLCVLGCWGFSYQAYVFYDCETSYILN